MFLDNIGNIATQFSSYQIYNYAGQNFTRNYLFYT